jgi:hypothetical protein
LNRITPIITPSEFVKVSASSLLSIYLDKLLRGISMSSNIIPINISCIQYFGAQ